MKIIIDAMGGDNAPLEIVKGALSARARFGCDIVLTGDEAAIRDAAARCGASALPQGVTVHPTTETVEMCDDPATVFRRKKDSSMGVALTLLRDGAGDAVVSAGSTGALLTGATLITKRIHGIRRAAMAPVIPTTTGSAVLIDCGGIGEGNAGDAAAEFLLQNGVARVDALLITHFHADHVNGVERLLARLDVEKLVYAAGCEQTGYMDDILDACADAGVTAYVIDRDTVLALGSLELTLFAPAAVGDTNERCMMVYGDWGDYEFLVTGDAPASVERALIESRDLGDMELLVVGHHGSRYSTDEALLDDIMPETALISVGAGNTYGHPTQEVLDRLEERGIEVRRTDESGTIIIKVEK